MTTQGPRQQVHPSVHRLRRAPTAAAVCLAFLGALAPAVSAARAAMAAQDPPQPAATVPQPPSTSPPEPSSSAPPPSPSLEPAPAPPAQAAPETAPPAVPTPEPPPPSTTAPPAAQPPAAPDTTNGVSAHMTAAKLLLVDVREVLRSPEHWNREDWALFGLEVAAVVGVGAVDESLQRDVRRSRSSFEDDLAKDFRTFGNYGSFEVLGGFYIAGLLVHDQKAQETTLDGLFASGIAGGLISPLLKLVVGRVRPNASQSAYDFHPFSVHNVSFPSGESTQAFAVAAVIATQYPNPWVEALSYTTAAVTSWGRVRENGHWMSDALAGAFIGYHVGRRVVHINQRLRARVTVNPTVANGSRGLVMTARF